MNKGDETEIELSLSQKWAKMQMSESASIALPNNVFDSIYDTFL